MLGPVSLDGILSTRAWRSGRSRKVSLAMRDRHRVPTSSYLSHPTCIRGHPRGTPTEPRRLSPCRLCSRKCDTEFTGSQLQYDVAQSREHRLSVPTAILLFVRWYTLSALLCTLCPWILRRIPERFPHEASCVPCGIPGLGSFHVLEAVSRACFARDSRH